MLTFMIALAVAAGIHPGMCRLSGTNSVRWQSSGPDAISASSSASDVGDVKMTCRIPVPAGAERVTVSVPHLWISFVTAGSKRPGSGLLLQLGDDCRAEVLRVTGEDWIESAGRAWSAKVRPGSRSMELILVMRDASELDPVRIDVRGLRVTPGRAEGAEDCSVR